MPTPSQFQIRISQLAFDHIAQIHSYISKVDYKPSVTDNVLKAIEHSILHSIPKNPYKFPECAARRTLARMYRQALVKNFKVIFSVRSEVITIIGVVHASRSKSLIKKLPRK
jgi:hypothetical protein